MYKSGVLIILVTLVLVLVIPMWSEIHNNNS
jgi:hypothetical protein